MKINIASIAAIVILTVIGLSGISCSDATAGSEGFAIYLTENNIAPADMLKQKNYDLEEQPLISSAEIINYTAASHEIKLTDAAYKRTFEMEIPVRGKTFAVCVNGKPVYWGAFWTPVSSISFAGIVICKPLVSDSSTIITIETGYPDVSFYRGTDPRNNDAIMQALEKEGKLLTVLPASFKGYELYSWQQEYLWHFTLITGTNRNKTAGEITSRSATVTQDGWVQIHVTGIDSIKEILARIPVEQWVSWLDGKMAFDQGSEINFDYPPDDVIAEFKALAQQHGFDLTIYK